MAVSIVEQAKGAAQRVHSLEQENASKDQTISELRAQVERLLGDIAAASEVLGHNNGTESHQPRPATTPVVRTTAKRDGRRRRGIRNPGLVEEMVLGAFDVLWGETDETQQSFSAAQILSAMDTSKYRRTPTRATVYRAIERLAAKGAFRIIKKGERGRFTYERISEQAPVPSTQRGRRHKVAA